MFYTYTGELVHGRCLAFYSEDQLNIRRTADDLHSDDQLIMYIYTSIHIYTYIYIYILHTPSSWRMEDVYICTYKTS